MILLAFWQNPAVIGLAVGAPSATLGYLAYRRSVRLDKVAEQAGVAAASATSIGQVVEGLNGIIENVQADNTALRAELGRVSQQVKNLNDRLDEVESGSVDLRSRNLELERMVHDLEVENAALKARILILENGATPAG